MPDSDLLVHKIIKFAVKNYLTIPLLHIIIPLWPLQ